MKSIDWREASRWWSLRVSALGSILFAAMTLLPDQLLALWNMMPAEIRAHVPARAGNLVSMALFLLVMIARLIPQDGSLRRLFASKAGAVKAKAAGGMATIALMIAGVIAVEGGYVNHPADPGGETNMGITKKVAIANGYAGPMLTLPREVAHSIYYGRYIVASGYEPLVSIDAPVAEELFDTTVNMGAPRPSRWFQLSINSQCGTKLTIDGRVGPGTIAAYRACQAKVGATQLCRGTLDRLDTAQKAEYARLVRVNPKLAVFHRGWVAHRIGNVDRAKCAVVA
ncbi:hypothetical protein GCM10022268_17410 [Sphingomonas cynarae]|uniref:Secretion activating protein n=1 Tax=Sphingomonas cynarae TaxID=930197 RepID=A0ABP7DPW9_9SPHN